MRLYMLLDGKRVEEFDISRKPRDNTTIRLPLEDVDVSRYYSFSFTDRKLRDWRWKAVRPKVSGDAAIFTLKASRADTNRVRRKVQ